MKFERHIAKPQALKIRLAASAEDIRVAQRLRYLVFHEEMGAQLSFENHAARLERDSYDDICDHLLVLCEGSRTESELSVHDGMVVGTYRLLQQSIAAQNHGFYSQAEFDMAPLLARKSNLQFLELGRSCVLKEHRGSAVVELLWQGIWNYVRQHHLDVMVGCASFEGTDINQHQAALRFLFQNAKAPSDWLVHAHASRRLEMSLEDTTKTDLKSIISNLPPLIKGYLRLGCYFGDDVVVDEAFNTIDMLVILPITQINRRYFARFGEPTN